MSEQNKEDGHFFVAGPGGSEKKVDVRVHHRPFTQIQNERKSLINNPNPTKERELSSERARLLRDAKDDGVLDEAKRDFALIQEQYNYKDAHDRIASYDTDRAEEQFEDSSLDNWRPEYQGILSEYRDMAVKNMGLAYLKAKGQGNIQEAKGLEREIKLRGWGLPPTYLEAKANDYIDSQIVVLPQPQQQVVGSTDRAADVLERQDREILSHEKRIGKRVRELREAGDPPGEWAKMVFEETQIAERLSVNKLKKSDEDNRVWEPLEQAIEAMPERLGSRDRTSEMAVFMVNKNPEGLYLKDRLMLIYDARKHFNDRYIEIKKAGGSLVAMGKGKDDVPFEGISYKLQVLPPQDWHMIYHSDEMFDDIQGSLSNREKREFLPDVGEASEQWLDTGRQYSTLPRGLLKPEERRVLDKIFVHENAFNRYYWNQNPATGRITGLDKDKKRPRKLDREAYWPDMKDIVKTMMPPRSTYLSRAELRTFLEIPTFKKGLNDLGVRNEIQRRIIQKTGSSTAEGLADRVFSVSLTYAMFDRDRVSAQGNDEDRDLMWSERKRVHNFGAKDREVPNEWTIGRNFVFSPDQGDKVKEKDAKADKRMAKRKTTLEINAERGVLLESEGYYEGELLADFLHTTVSVPDDLKPGELIDRKLSSYVIAGDGSVIKGGFKNIPFLRMGERSYAGFFGYNVGVADRQVTALGSVGWERPEELGLESFWGDRWTLLDRMSGVSPRFNSREYENRGGHLRQALLNAGTFNPGEIAKISGYSSAEDLSVITNRAQRARAASIARNMTINGKNLAKISKDDATKFWSNNFEKIRMMDALGQVWSGSLDATSRTGGILSTSRLEPEMLANAIKAIDASGYLSGDYLEQFRLEVWQEMGFGPKWSAGTKKRYRIK